MITSKHNNFNFPTFITQMLISTHCQKYIKPKTYDINTLYNKNVKQRNNIDMNQSMRNTALLARYKMFGNKFSI